MMKAFDLSYEELLEAMGYGKWGHRSQLMRWAKALKEAA